MTSAQKKAFMDKALAQPATNRNPFAAMPNVVSPMDILRSLPANLPMSKVERIERYWDARERRQGYDTL